MRRLWPVALVVGLLLPGAWGAAYGQPSPSPQNSPTAQQESKKDRKKKKKPDTSQDDTSQDAKDRRAIHELVQDVQDGMEGHSTRRVTGTLDDRFYDFPRFEDAVTQFLDQTTEMRIYFRESSTEVKGDKAILIVDAEMAFAPKAKPTQDISRRQRVQFDFARTDKGWKIIDITPRNFFTF